MDGPADESALARAERLVAFANHKGGHDNITVAIADLREKRDRLARDASNADAETADSDTEPADSNDNQDR